MVYDGIGRKCIAQQPIAVRCTYVTKHFHILVEAPWNLYPQDFLRRLPPTVWGYLQRIIDFMCVLTFMPSFSDNPNFHLEKCPSLTLNPVI